MSYILIYPTETAFVWHTVVNADTYVLKVGTATGQSDIFNQDVGNVINYFLHLAPGTYYSNVIPMDGATPLTALGEQMVVVI